MGHESVPKGMETRQTGLPGLYTDSDVIQGRLSIRRAEDAVWMPWTPLEGNSGPEVGKWGRTRFRYSQRTGTEVPLPVLVPGLKPPFAVSFFLESIA